MAALVKRRTPSLGAVNTPPPQAQPTMIVDMPTPCSMPQSPPLLQQKPGQGCSLYHTCRSVLDKLACVEGMEEFVDCHLQPSSSTSSSSSDEPTTPTTQCANDPLSKLWSVCRQGSPLCILFNALCPDTPLKVNKDPNLNQVNTCKARVYQFIVACRNQLSFPEEDLFTIMDLYNDDTNCFVKVVSTINKVLDLLEEKGVISVRSSNRDSDPNAPKNTRDKVVLELLETERKYVHDLETLQSYMRELQQQKVLSANTIHYLFGNLNALADFQRRFLIQLEDAAEKEQNFGLLFVQMEDAFAVYEPYCANYYSAQDLVVQEAPKLQKLAHVLNPTYELPSMLIKPIQRICKYPLLLTELIKSTPKDWPYYADMTDGLEAVKRVTEKVNETQRKHENDQAVEELKRRVDSWKGRAIEDCGSLLLQDKLILTSKDTDREYSVFFFEKELTLCKESKEKTIIKTNAIAMKKKRRGSLQLKVRIRTPRILAIHNRSQNGVWALQIDYKSPEIESFVLKFRSEESLKLWESSLNKAVKATRIQTPNTHLYSMPSPTQAEHVSFTDEEEDEEDELDDYDEDEDEFQQHVRSRSNSLSAALFNNLTRPKMARENSSSRFMPGMNLSPIPRQSTSATTHQQNHAQDYGMYPASPPPSHPSSPTSSTRISGGMWQRRHAMEDAPLTEAASRLMSDMPTPTYDDMRPPCMPHVPPPVGRTQSQSSASFVPVMPPSSIKHTRMRSQSSPNIHKAANAHHPAMPPPQMPPVYYQSIPETAAIRSVASTPRLSDRARSPSLQAQCDKLMSQAPLSPGTLKVKLNYNEGIYVIVTAEQVRFAELMERVEKKIRIVANLTSNEPLRLKYQDEDGDYITINSDDDVQMAFESRGLANTVNLFVNL